MKRVDTIVLIVCFLLTIASLMQTFLYLVWVPADAVFPLVHNYEPDYYWYLSLMRQGWEGNILVTSRFTSESFPPVLVNTFFPLMGLAAHGMNLSLPVMYTLARIVGGTLLLFFSWMHIRNGSTFGAGRSQAIRVVVMALVVIGAPVFRIADGQIIQWGEFWTGFDPILRISWLPHHTLANVAFITILLLISGFLQQKPLHLGRKAAALLALSFLSVWLNPGVAIVLAGSMGIAAVLSVFTWRQWILPVIVVITGMLIAAGGLLFVQNSVFPWTAFRDWETHVFYPVDVINYLGILGVTGIGALLSLPVVWTRKSFMWNVIAGWFLVPFIGLGVFQFILPISNGRYLQGATYIPAALLTGAGIEYVLGRLSSQKWRQAVTVTCLLLVAVVTLPSFLSSVVRQVRYVHENAVNTTVNVPRDLMEGLRWIDHHGRPEDVVFSLNSHSLLVPAFTGMRVVWGHPTFTYRISDKEFGSWNVLAGGDVNAARVFLHDERVRYVVMHSPAPWFDEYIKSIGYTVSFSEGETTVWERSSLDY